MRATSKFSKSIGVGLASLTGSSGRTYYVLQHRTPVSGRAVGTNRKVMVEYAELGRDPNCAIRFGEDTPMVSRKHASIVKDKDGYQIRQLSKTNQTIVNGRPVNNQWFLKHGDEIELANGGPKMAFLIPNNPTVGSIPIGERLSLFRQQALRPYRQGMYAMAAILLLTVGGLGYWIKTQDDQIYQLEFTMAETSALSAARADSLEAANAANREVQAAMAGQVESLQGQLASERRNRERDRQRLQEEMEELRAASERAAGEAPAMDALFKDVFFILMPSATIQMGSETREVELGISGTGFLLDDGRFVTARHVAEPWFFSVGQDEAMTGLNAIANNGGQVIADVIALSPDGRELRFKSTDFTVDRSGDRRESVAMENGDELVLRVADGGGTDWATARPRGARGSIKSGGRLSTRLEAQTELHVLGYPLGTGANSRSDIRPIYSQSSVGRSGLDSGVILTTGRNIDHGNSGGPAFVNDGGEFKAIGIISAGRGETLGIIVPISNID